MDDQRLISHLLSELRHITDIRIEMASHREWRRNTDLRISSLESSSKRSQEQLQQHSKSSGLAANLRQHAAALIQWACVMIMAVLSAAKMLPPSIEKLISVLARGS